MLNTRDKFVPPGSDADVPVIVDPDTDAPFGVSSAPIESSSSASVAVPQLGPVNIEPGTNVTSAGIVSLIAKSLAVIVPRFEIVIQYCTVAPGMAFGLVVLTPSDKIRLILLTDKLAGWHVYRVTLST